MSRLADSRHDDASAAIQNELHRSDEGVRQTLRQRGDRARLGVEDFARQRKCALRIDGAIDGGLRSGGLHRAKVYAGEDR